MEKEMSVTKLDEKQGGFSFITRQHNLERMAGERFDYIIVGGGITGAGIAREAAMRGRRVALIEKNDFAFGTSSRSSKLVHGGVRYLETYEFGLVFEASTERRRLRHMAPYMVLPLPFLLPIYKGAKNGFYKIMAGMWLYDVLSLFRNIKRHKMLRKNEVLKIFPALQPDGLQGAPRYYDCGVDDARLTLVSLISAHQHGAVIANYAQATGLLKDGGKVCGAVVKDVLTGQEITVRGAVVISALGPWTDNVLKMDDPNAHSLMRPTKGVHILVKRSRLGSDHALGYFSPRDNRLMFLIPWREFSIIGTTDTDYRSDLDAVYADNDDIEYILDAINVQFPGVNLSRADIISTYAGVRPLVAAEGKNVSESAVSREHKIWETPSGLLCIAGGKLTTYRSMAKQLIDVAERKLARLTGQPKATDPHSEREALMGGEPGMQEELKTRAEATWETRLPADVINHLLLSYGSAFDKVTALLNDKPGMAERVAPGLPYIKAEVLHAVRNEMAISLTDVMSRRLHLLMEEDNQGLDQVDTVAALMAQETGWTAAQQAQQAEDYRQEVARTRAYR
jgi:glycerol-3-phosphate dehydrogenase